MITNMYQTELKQDIHFSPLVSLLVTSLFLRQIPPCNLQIVYIQISAQCFHLLLWKLNKRETYEKEAVGIMRQGYKIEQN